MRIAIIITSGPAVGRRIVLRGGQVARIGRTDAADLALPEDLELAETHFTIQCSDENATLLASVADRETRLNGVPASQAAIQNGDVIEAGSSSFRVEIEGAKETTAENLSSAASDRKEGSSREDLKAIAEYIGLSQESIELSRSATDPKHFGELLAQQPDVNDALRWYAYVMPKPQSVLWACECVEDVMKEQQHATQSIAYSAALRWAKEPTDEQRELAKQVAEQAQFDGIGGALATAAGLSEGSLGPAHLDPIPPDDRLTSQCVCVALTLASFAGNPQDAPVRLRSYLTRLPKNPVSDRPR